MRSHKTPDLGDPLPRYSESDPMYRHGIDSQDDRYYESQHLFLEEENTFENLKYQDRSSNGLNHSKALSEVELAIPIKTGIHSKDNEEFSHGPFRLSRLWALTFYEYGNDRVLMSLRRTLDRRLSFSDHGAFYAGLQHLMICNIVQHSMPVRLAASTARVDTGYFLSVCTTFFIIQFRSYQSKTTAHKRCHRRKSDVVT